jgi:cell division protein FtsW
MEIKFMNRQKTRKKTIKKNKTNTNKKDRDRFFVERLDLKMTITLIFLCCLGLLMLYSASSYECSVTKDYNYDSAYLLKKQMLFMVLGIGLVVVLRLADYHWLIKLAIPIYIIGSLSPLLVKTPLGVSSHGARRWINLVIIQFQIAELVKISTIIFLAYMIYRFFNARGSNILTVYIWCAGGFPAVMVYWCTNDLSSALVIVGITFLTTLVCMRTWKLHLIVAAVGIIVVVLYIHSIAANMPTVEELDNMSFRVGRIAAFLNPERYADNQGYQVLQSLYAVASGGLFGKGLGNSTQKLGSIPESQNDMIFSIICEELGLFGALILLGLFAYLCFHIVKVALASREAFGSVLAMGVFLHIGLQTIINVAVNLNWMPNTGIALPLISYGGTAILCQLAELGLVYSVERNNRLYAIERMKMKERMARMNAENNQG